MRIRAKKVLSAAKGYARQPPERDELALLKNAECLIARAIVVTPLHKTVCDAAADVPLISCRLYHGVC